MRSTLVVSVILLAVLVVVAGAPFPHNKLSPAAINRDIVRAAEDDNPPAVEDPSQVLSERRRRAHDHSVDDVDHNRGHHSQRAATQDKALHRTPAPTKRADDNDRGYGQQNGGGGGGQEEWRQYVPEAYRKYLPAESSTAAAVHKRTHSRTHRASAKTLIDEAAAAEAEAAVEAAPTDSEAEVTEEVAEDVAAAVAAVEVADVEKAAVVTTSSSVSWLFILFAAVLISAAGIAVAAYIAAKKQSEYALLPTREIY